MLQTLTQKNPQLKFFSANDSNELFQKVNIDYSDVILLSGKLTFDKDNNYIANDQSMLELTSIKTTEREIFGELPIQAGWCYGGNKFMQGMEWHKSSEVVVACSDCVLLLGSYNDVVDNQYESSKAIALYLKKGEAAELLPLTLHLAPLPVDEYFKVGIILPKGTNLPLAGGISGSLRAINKWLLVHKDNEKGIKNGGMIGVVGKNLSLNN